MLAIFDFDHSLIHVDSDTHIFELIAPAMLPSFKQLYGTVEFPCWTDLMHHQLQQLSLQPEYSKQRVLEALQTVKLDAALVSALQSMLLTGNAEFAIVSDANNIFIDTILRNNNVLNDDSSNRSIFTTKHIYTNKATWQETATADDNSKRYGLGCVDVQRFHSPTLTPHHCSNKCPPNLCKGSVLQQLKQNLNISSDAATATCTHRLIYLGDGGNDFCPSTLLAADDWLLVKRNFTLDTLVTQHADRIKAQVHRWDTQAEAAVLYQQFLSYCTIADAVAAIAAA